MSTSLPTFHPVPGTSSSASPPTQRMANPTSHSGSLSRSPSDNRLPASRFLRRSRQTRQDRRALVAVSIDGGNRHFVRGTDNRPWNHEEALQPRNHVGPPVSSSARLHHPEPNGFRPLWLQRHGVVVRAGIATDANDRRRW